MNSVRVFVPATVANVGSGFDILGFALETPGDEIVISLSDKKGITITNSTAYHLPLEPEKNVAGIALKALLDHLKSNQGFEIEIARKIKPGSGLGSSAASSVASIFGANMLLGNPVSLEDLIPFAMEGERYVTGVAHADNVAPALLGGFVLIRSYKPLDIIKIPCPHELYCSIVHPQIEIRTEDARKILKDTITMAEAVIQWGNVAGLIAGLMKADYELIGRSLEDVIIEPVRSMLIPGFEEVKAAAIATGALGCSISGSGPSIFALSTSKEIAHAAAERMQKAFRRIKIESNTYVSFICQTGPSIIT